MDEIDLAKEIILGCIYEIEYNDLYTQYYFTIDDIDSYKLEYEKVKQPCRYCDYGESNYVIATLCNKKGFLVIENWCGCLSYDLSYDIKHFETHEDCIKYVERQFLKNFNILHKFM